MLIEISPNGRVTLPNRVLKALGARPGDRLRLEERPGGFLLIRRRPDLSRLAPLRSRIRRGAGTFDLQRFREEMRDPKLRD